MPQLTFGLVMEGATDYPVINAILTGCLRNDEVTVEIQPIQPDPNADQGSSASFGGWLQVLAFIASPAFEEAFQFNQFMIVHVDTDKCQEIGFDVNIFEAGAMLEPSGVVSRVGENLKVRIGDDVWARVGHRIIFAIAVDSIECWLVAYHGAQGKKKRYHACLTHLNDALRTRGEKPLGANKDVKDYNRLAKPLSKPKEIAAARIHNDSLSLFIAEVARVISA